MNNINLFQDKKIRSAWNEGEQQPNTFNKNKKVAKRGGNVAGVAREQAEKELGRSIISPQNFLANSEKEEPPQLSFDTNSE